MTCESSLSRVCSVCILNITSEPEIRFAPPRPELSLTKPTEVVVYLHTTDTCEQPLKGLSTRPSQLLWLLGRYYSLPSGQGTDASDDGVAICRTQGVHHYIVLQFLVRSLMQCHPPESALFT